MTGNVQDDQLINPESDLRKIVIFFQPRNIPHLLKAEISAKHEIPSVVEQREDESFAQHLLDFDEVF